MDEALSWSDANAACLAAGLQLASVQSEAEDTLLVTAAAGNTVWIGGTDAASEGTWAWSPSGTPLSYTNWNVGEPNNVGGNEHCLAAVYTGGWNDASCDILLKYVCETPTSPPSPPTAPPTCCRWTADDTCGAVVPAERFEVCTHMHEYLEGKTTTHEFADLDTCLGPDASKWSAKFDGANSNVTLSYDAVAKATLKTPLKVTHAADCGNDPPTLTVQMDTVHDGSLTLDGGSLTLGGNEVHSAPKLLFRYDFPAAANPGDHTFAAGSGTWRDVPDLTHTPILTKTSTILLVHYQISYSMGFATDTGTYLCCRLMVDGTEETSARSIDGSGVYGTSSGTWIGEITGAGSPVIKVQCRNSDALNLYSDYMTKALSVAIIG